MVQRRVGDFEAVTVTVPQNTDIVPTRWYALDGFIGMSNERVITGPGQTSKVALEIAQKRYEIQEQVNEADAFALGDDVYFDTGVAANGKNFRSVAKGAAAPNGTSRKVGRVVVAKDGGNAVWFGRTVIDS